MDNFNWQCPYCGNITTITEPNYAVVRDRIGLNNKHGIVDLRITKIACPNLECKELAITAELFKTKRDSLGNIKYSHELIKKWQLMPDSNAKQYPDYIPLQIRNDYEEACLISNLSPKASATLARRCLQGILRDFWEAQGRSLADEIKNVENKIDTIILEAINAVRHIGNIGAHMERDVDLIIEVEPQEADALIKLIEMLIEETYIAKHVKEQKLSKVIKINEQKQEERKIGSKTT